MVYLSFDYPGHMFVYLLAFLSALVIRPTNFVSVLLTISRLRAFGILLFGLCRVRLSVYCFSTVVLVLMFSLLLSSLLKIASNQPICFLWLHPNAVDDMASPRCSSIRVVLVATIPSGSSTFVATAAASTF